MVGCFVWGGFVSVDNGIDVGVVVVGIRRALQFVGPAVVSELLDSAGGGIVAERAAGLDAGISPGNIELKPLVILAEEAVVVIGPMLFDHVPVGHLAVFHK